MVTDTTSVVYPTLALGEIQEHNTQVELGEENSPWTGDKNMVQSWEVRATQNMVSRPAVSASLGAGWKRKAWAPP